MVTVYGLTDPNTNTVRYIGITIDLKRRYRRHLADGGDSHRVRWIKKLLALGLKPGLEILEIVADELAQKAERKWIKHYGRKNLVNATDGGDGLWNPSWDVRRKISRAGIGRQKSPAELENMRLRAIGNSYGLGHVVSDEHRAVISKTHKGKVLSEETRRKISETRKARGCGIGNSLSAETRLKISEANKGKPKSEEHRRKLSEARRRAVLLKKEMVAA